MENDQDSINIIERGITQPATKSKIVKEYRVAMNFFQKILSCAVCGEKDFYADASKMKYMKLGDLELLHLPQEKIDAMDATPEEYRPVFSVYPISGDTRWHLHPEFVFIPLRDPPIEADDYPSHQASGTTYVYR